MVQNLGLRTLLGADNVRCWCEYFHLTMMMMIMMMMRMKSLTMMMSLTMIMMMTMMKRLMSIMMILMFRAITSQKESCLSEFLPLAEMLTNLEM